MGLRVEPAMTRKNFDTPSFFSQKVAVVNAWFWCDTSIVNRIWSHGDEVSFIAPSGYYATYHAIRDQLVVGLFGANFTQRELKKGSLKISINGDSAWSEFYWTFHATKLDGTPHDTKGRETQIFERSADGSWRLVHIHYSGVGTR